MYRDKPYRSLLKTVSWRITGTIDTVIISWLVTRRFTFAFSIGLIELFTKMVLYYLHERLWDRTHLGRTLIEPPEYQI